MKTMAKFEKETRHRLYVFIKKKLLTRRNAEQQRAHMTRSVHLHMHDVLTVPLIVLYAVQVQAWRVHCPISAQIGLVRTNHVREFYYGFDQYFHCFCFITPWVPFIIPRKAFKGTCLHNDWIAKIRSSTSHRGKKGQSHWKIIFFCDMKTEIQDGQIALMPHKRMQFYIQLFSLLFSLRRQETQIAYARKRHSSINKFHTF